MRTLQLDHVFGGGLRERTGDNGLRRSRVFVWGMALKDDEGRYQILCANCHAIKSHEENQCRLLAACKEN